MANTRPEVVSVEPASEANPNWVSVLFRIPPMSPEDRKRIEDRLERFQDFFITRIHDHEDGTQEVTLLGNDFSTLYLKSVAERWGTERWTDYEEDDEEAEGRTLVPEMFCHRIGNPGMRLSVAFRPPGWKKKRYRGWIFYRPGFDVRKVEEITRGIATRTLPIIKESYFCDPYSSNTPEGQLAHMKAFEEFRERVLAFLKPSHEFFYLDGWYQSQEVALGAPHKRTVIAYFQ